MRFETARTGRQSHPDSQTDVLARGLGVFSIALGLAEVFAARSILAPSARTATTSSVQAYRLWGSPQGSAFSRLAPIRARLGLGPRMGGRSRQSATLLRRAATPGPTRTHVDVGSTPSAAVAGTTTLDVSSAQALGRSVGRGPAAAVARAIATAQADSRARWQPCAGRTHGGEVGARLPATLEALQGLWERLQGGGRWRRCSRHPAEAHGSRPRRRRRTGAKPHGGRC